VALVRQPLLAVAAFSLVMNLLMLAPSLFMMQVFDRVLSSGSRETLLMLLLGVATALGLSFLLDVLRSRLQGVVGNLLGDALLPAVVSHVTALSARSPQGSSDETLRDVAKLRSLFSAQPLLAVFDAPWALVYVAVIWLAHPLLGLAAALAALLMLALALLNDRLTRRGIEQLGREGAQAQRYLQASLANAEVTEAMGMGPALLKRWQSMNARVQALQQATAPRSVGLAAFTRTARQAIQSAVLAIGAYLVITQAGTPGIMVATTVLLGRALAPVEQIVGSWKLLAEGRAALQRLREMLQHLAAEPAAMPLPAPTGQLQLQNVFLRAAPDAPFMLSGVSLELAAGEALAVVGASGAGKSSLVRVLAGLWQPQSGTVRLDGADLRRCPRQWLGPHLGYLPQDVELFNGTVAENIARLGEVDPQAVMAASLAAGVHEMIQALPQGYDTPVQAGSSQLSPGQRQRIGLARALYGHPRILLLDEPNANLDGAGELALANAITALKGKTTVVMVTHRPSLVHCADKMLVLDRGRCLHFGSRDQVLKALAGQSAVGAAPEPDRARGITA
jgi:PrtD family type I secretion system ABC transporter